MPRAGLSPEVVTRAAADLADELGLVPLTLAAVARRLGVRAPSLYAHVTGESDLKQRVALLALAESADRVAAAVAGRSGRAALDALGRAYGEYAADHPGRHEATALRLDDEVAAVGAGPRHASLARAALRSYALGEPDETHAVRMLGATVRGWTDLERAGGFSGSLPAADTTWERVVDGLDEVFSSWASGPPARGRSARTGRAPSRAARA